MTTIAEQIEAANRAEMVPHYTVRACPETGEYLDEPRLVGAVNFGDWCDKRDTDAVHYDHFERDIPDAETTQTCAIEVHYEH